MPPRPEIDRFLDAIGHDLAFSLSPLLEKELSPSDPLVRVQCGEERALLCASDEELIFYFVEVSTGKVPPAPLIVRTDRIAPPRDATISEERLLLGDSHHGHVLMTTKLAVKHDALPHGKVECDCSKMDDHAVAQVRELFSLWIAPRR